MRPRASIASLLLLLPSRAGGLALPPAIVKLERASRELAASVIYEGIIQGREPLEIFDDEQHISWWFEGGAKKVASELKSLGEEREYATRAPIPPKSSPASASPLLAARARRATPTHRILPNLQTPPPVPEGATPDGPSSTAPDLRSGASRGLVRAKLAALQPRRAALETAIDEMLDPLAAPKLPAFDLAVLLLFLSELEGAELPVPVACKEAVALSVAYSGDEQQSHRHINGLLVSYARESLGMHVPAQSTREAGRAKRE